MKTALSEKLNNIADILEKTAVYLDTLEVKEAAEQKEKIAEEYIKPLTEKMAESFSFDVEPELASKLEKLDPEVLGLLKKLSSEKEEKSNASLGGPAEVYNVKRSDTGLKLAEFEDSDDALLDFCLS